MANNRNQGYELIDDINKVLGFWFGFEKDQKEVIRQQSVLWWGKDVNIDFDIKERFEETYQLAINDKLDDWLNSIKGQLALIIVLDQFSRVIHRDSATAFSQDSKALKIALEGISKGYDDALSFVERIFYLHGWSVCRGRTGSPERLFTCRWSIQKIWVTRVKVLNYFRSFYLKCLKI